MEPTSAQRSALLQNYVAAFLPLEDHYRHSGDKDKAAAVATIDNKTIIGWIERYFVGRSQISAHIEDSCQLHTYKFPDALEAAVEQYLLLHGWPQAGAEEIWDLIRQE